MEYFLLGCLFLCAILFALGLTFLASYGVVIVADGLFGVDWSGQIWLVFLAIIIIQFLIGSTAR